MTLTDGVESSGGKEALEKADRQLDWVDRAKDQASGGADQEREMDLGQEPGANLGADNACKSGPSGVSKMEEENYGVSAEGELTVSSPFQHPLFSFYE